MKQEELNEILRLHKLWLAGEAGVARAYLVGADLRCADLREAHEALNAALAEPPRNCDLYTVGEALSKYGFPTKIKQWGEKEWLDFCEWLVSEAKGATDEQKQ